MKSRSTVVKNVELARRMLINQRMWTL